MLRQAGGVQPPRGVHRRAGGGRRETRRRGDHLDAPGARRRSRQTVRQTGALAFALTLGLVDARIAEHQATVLAGASTLSQELETLEEIEVTGDGRSTAGPTTAPGGDDGKGSPS